MSQESEQAQETWSRKGDEYELNLDGPYLTGISDYKAALKAEIEKLESCSNGDEVLVKLFDVLSLLDTVKPKS